jgi:hypothetical protein
MARANDARPRIVEDERNYRLNDNGTVVRRFAKKTWTKREVECFRAGYELARKTAP